MTGRVELRPSTMQGSDNDTESVASTEVGPTASSPMIRINGTCSGTASHTSFDPSIATVPLPEYQANRPYYSQILALESGAHSFICFLQPGLAAQKPVDPQRTIMDLQWFAGSVVAIRARILRHLCNADTYFAAREWTQVAAFYY